VTAQTASEILPSLSQSAAFDGIAQDYDRIFTHSLLGRAHRSLVHSVLRRHLRKGQRVLDLNCGTGEDAIYLASLGVPVLACDISVRMVEVARQKAECSGYGSIVELMVCANEQLANLADRGPFDAILSNFGGLNCTADLAQVASELSRLVRPGGRIFLCMINRSCAWEILWYATRGNWRKAFRRLSPGGTRASIGGTNLDVRYPSVSDMRRAFAPLFRLESWSGIGVVLMPSGLASGFQERKWLIDLLKRIDRWLGALPLFRGFADHILFEFVREEK
jgi:ubiquinone/menaquinone biosynthesis C-methylase UbiE